MNALDSAIKVVGGQSALAKKLGVSVQTVHNWIRRGNVPVEHIPSIEEATGGAVTAEQLRPDIPWHVIRGNPPECSSTEVMNDPDEGIFAPEVRR